jgi:hypothetical protein
MRFDRWRRQPEAIMSLVKDVRDYYADRGMMKKAYKTFGSKVFTKRGDVAEQLFRLSRNARPYRQMVEQLQSQYGTRRYFFPGKSFLNRKGSWSKQGTARSLIGTLNIKHLSEVWINQLLGTAFRGRKSSRMF